MMVLMMLSVGGGMDRDGCNRGTSRGEGGGGRRVEWSEGLSGHSLHRIRNDWVMIWPKWEGVILGTDLGFSTVLTCLSRIVFE